MGNKITKKEYIKDKIEEINIETISDLFYKKTGFLIYFTPPQEELNILEEVFSGTIHTVNVFVVSSHFSFFSIKIKYNKLATKTNYLCTIRLSYDEFISFSNSCLSMINIFKQKQPEKAEKENQRNSLNKKLSSEKREEKVGEGEEEGGEEEGIDKINEIKNRIEDNSNSISNEEEDDLCPICDERKAGIALSCFVSSPSDPFFYFS